MAGSDGAGYIRAIVSSRSKSSYLDQGSFLIIEEMLPGCELSPRFTGDDNRPLATSRIRWIKKVHAIQFSYRGCYLGRNFGKNPHYSLCKDRFEKEVRNQCEERGIPMKIYPRNKPISSSDLIVVFNYGSDFDTHILPTVGDDDYTKDMNVALDELMFGDLTVSESTKQTSPAMESSTLDRSRGALQKHYGYTSNYSLTRLSPEEGGYVCPRLMKDDLSDDWRDRFAVMTRLGDLMYGHPSSKKVLGNPKFPLFGDQARTNKFASLITQTSKIEALTCSITSNPGNELKIHMDVNNDDTITGAKHNYNYVVCAWQHKENKDKDRVERCAVLGYSRRSVGDFIRRSQSCNAFVNDVIKPWIATSHYWQSKKQPNVGIFHQEYFSDQASVDATGDLVFPPSTNKQATYLSAYADVFLRFKKTYESTGNLVMSVEKQLECLLPLAFCNCAVPYVRVLEHWMNTKDLMNKCPTENIAAMFVAQSDPRLESFRQGGRPRHRPTFNKDPSISWIFFALRGLRQIIRHSISTKIYSYKRLVSDLKLIPGLGDLTAQHMIHILCLVNLLDPKYGMEAVICFGEKTARRLYNQHGISKSNYPCLLEYVAVQLDCSKNFAENVTSRALQMPGSRFRDTITVNQQQVMWVAKHKGVAMVHCVTRCTKNQHKAHIDRVSRLVYSTNLPFEEGQVPPDYLGEGSVSVALKYWHCTYNVVSLSRMGINDYQRPASKKRKLPAGRFSLKTKRAMSCGVADYDVCAMPKIEWKKMDEQQLRKYSREYNEEVRRKAFTHLKDSDYMRHRDTGFSDLRVIHDIARHRVSSRERKMTLCSPFGDISRDPTHLMSLGVEVLSVDLYRIAMSSCLMEYQRNTPGSDDPVICKISTYHSTERTGRKRTLHWCYASVLSLDKSRTVLETTYVSKNHRRLSIRESFCVNNPNSLLTSPPSHADAQTYTTVAAAKEDLLWYIAIRNSSSHLWLANKCPLHLWKSLSLPTQDGIPTKNTSVVTSYLLLTLQNGPANSNKGNVFCTMKRDTQSRVVVCFHNGTKQERLFDIGVVEFGEPHMEDKMSEAPIKDSQTELVQRPELSSPGSSPPNEKRPEKESLPMLTTLSKDSSPGSSPPNEKRPEKESLPKLTTLSKVLEIDPFGKIDGCYISLGDYEYYLDRWATFWTDVSHEWKCTYVIRKTGSGGDKYWHPPGISLYKRGIRSRKDLFSYLEYCVLSTGNPGEENGRINHTLLLTQWLESKRKC